MLPDDGDVYASEIPTAGPLGSAVLVILLVAALLLAASVLG